MTGNDADSQKTKNRKKVPKKVNTVLLLVVSEHPSVSLAAAICTVFQLLDELRVPFPYFSCILQLCYNHIHQYTPVDVSIEGRVSWDNVHLAYSASYPFLYVVNVFIPRTFFVYPHAKVCMLIIYDG